MNKLELIYSPYELKLRKPFITSKGEIAFRRGFIVKLRTQDGVTGTGDVAPFPQFGSETYEEAENRLSDFTHSLTIDTTDFAASFESNFSDLELPSVRCGLEQALLTLLAAEKSTSLNHILKRPSKSRININAVIGMIKAQAAARMAAEFVEDGFMTLKVKMGREYFDEDLAALDSIRSAAGSAVRLRVDINSKWTLKEAVKNLRQLEPFNIEFAEQPVRTLKDYIELSKNTSVSLAPDESVRNYDDAINFINSGGIKFLVLKPMMIGGIIPLLKIYDAAEEKGITVVVTSSIESSIGRAYAVFGASLIRQEIAHGLATEDFFESKLLPETYPVKNGIIQL